ncbi:MAG: protein-L-isoaspartate(D-aspartate) O-methyltransferase [Candidatus Krumholzibacteria bacterium]|nr:protein-L-isoaspartate(D-aspartate) O-methyltransferase [Candidatus Krumholzibacteria bacterium]
MLLALLAASSGCSSGEQVYEKHRFMMVREQIESRGIEDEAVLEAMRGVPRHFFVPSEYMSMAYIDSPLPIGEEQTISQPYIVALMTASLEPGPGDRILEIGTGSGYQAAVLACIVDSVFSIEIIPGLAASAEALLDSLGYDNVMVKTGDGYYGWPAKGPFDGIIVTAAAPRLPDELTSQLNIGGRLVIPVGRFPQKLQVYIKRPEGLELISSTSVRFVPMTGRIREEKGNEDAE